MNKMQKGAQSEARFIALAFEKGWEVAKPFHSAQGYDYVIRRDGNWETVQVKTAFYALYGFNRDRPGYIVSLKRLNKAGMKPYKRGDFDLLFAVTDKKYWLIPYEIIAHIRSNIVISGPKYNDFRV